ncbi:MAG: hypothetical protein KatS3mg062_0149 [Tepidiforma sp.]|nr:MAG: hypothetical protein KatS3mg062_0149 [Tepidiforma sp.]
MWIAFLAVLIGGLLLVVTGWLGLNGRLPRQHLVGIRTPYALSSDERWAAVHRFGGIYLLLGGVAAVAAAAAVLPFSIAGALPDGFAVAVLLGLAVVVGGTALAAWLLGEAAARRQLGG